MAAHWLSQLEMYLKLFKFRDFKAHYLVNEMTLAREACFRGTEIVCSRSFIKSFKTGHGSATNYCRGPNVQYCTKVLTIIADLSFTVDQVIGSKELSQVVDWSTGKFMIPCS